LPDDKALPPPDEEYLEMETAKAFHYTWSEWLAESPILKAKLIAHELVKGMRDTYNFDQRSAVGEKGASGPKQPAPWDTIRSRFFK
jgi:hypothetical protein